MPLPSRLTLAFLFFANFAFADHHGARSIFNGEDLKEWSGDPKIWRVEDGTITGQTTAANPIENNTFLIWDGEVADFELQAEFKLAGDSANSGVQYRSKVIDADNWIMAGYQADMDYKNRYTGMIYEERGRGILVRPGLRLDVMPGHTMKTPAVVALGADTPESVLKSSIHQGDWNRLLVIARGNHLRHYVNGVLTAESTDRDPGHASTSGKIALQVHRGPPMTVQFRNVKLRHLSEDE